MIQVAVCPSAEVNMDPVHWEHIDHARSARYV
jgi:hypothetical protein